MCIGHKGILGVGITLRLVSRDFSLQKSWFAPGAVRMGLMAVRMSLIKALLWVIWGSLVTSPTTNALFSSICDLGYEYGPINIRSSTEVYCMLIPPHEWKTIHGLLYCFIFLT